MVASDDPDLMKELRHENSQPLIAASALPSLRFQRERRKEVNCVEVTKVSQPGDAEQPQPISIRKLDKIETTHTSSNPSG